MSKIKEKAINQANAEQQIVKSVPAMDSVVTDLIELSKLGGKIDKLTNAQKQSKAHLGLFFEQLISQHAHDTAILTKNRITGWKVANGNASIDDVILETEHQFAAAMKIPLIKAEGKVAKQQPYRKALPAAWAQYCSNARLFISTGLAKKNEADKQPVSIGKVNERLQEYRKEKRDGDDPFRPAMNKIATLVDKAKQSNVAVTAEVLRLVQMFGAELERKLAPPKAKGEKLVPDAPQELPQENAA